MFALAIVLLFVTGARAHYFNITHLIVPEEVPPGENEVDIECRYDGNFTLLNWFKGPNEFFRYRPYFTPSTRSFPILGVGTIDLIDCGPNSCRLRLGMLTEEATGLYRCDIERDVPPYMFETRTAFMKVNGVEHRRPLLEGLASQYGDHDEIQAYCRGASDSELRWYINGREVEDMRGSATLMKKSSRLLFLGVPPVVTVQCAEFLYGKLTGSKEAKAQWNNTIFRNRDIAKEQRVVAVSSSVRNKLNLLTFFSISLLFVIGLSC